MLKKFLFALLGLPLLLAAGVKLDIDGRNAGMNIKAISGSPKMSWQHPAWAKSTGYMIFTRGAGKNWRRLHFTFVSDKDGELTISRRGISSKNTENHWMIYKDVKITGAEVVFHAASKAAVKGLDAGEERCGHFHSVIDYVKVKANVPVKVEFMVRREGTYPASKFTLEEYKLPVPVRKKKIALSFTIDGRAGGVPVQADTLSGFSRREDKLRFRAETGRINFISSPVIGDEWKRFSFSFVPGLNGDVGISRCNARRNSNIAEWVEFRNFKIEGGKHMRHLSSRLTRPSAGVVRMCYRAPLYDSIRVEKGKKVTVSFEARTAGSQSESDFARNRWLLDQGTRKVGWQDKQMKLLAEDDLGDCFTPYGKGFHSLDYPGVSFDLPASDKASRTEFSVPVEVLEENGISRNAVIRFGFPLPENSFYNLKNLGIFTKNGKGIPANIYAVSYWKDRSVKWAMIEFESRLEAGKKSVFIVKGGKNIRSVGNSLPKITRNGKKQLISNGKLSAVVNPDSDALLENIIFNGKNFGKLKLIAGKDARSRIFSVKQESGSTIRLDGMLISDRYIGGFTVRFGMLKNSSILRAVVTYRADNLAYEVNELDSLHLQLVAGKGTLLSGGMFQGNDLKYTVNGVEKSGFMPDEDVFAAPAGKVAFALTDAGKRYPKAFVSDAGGLDIQLLVPHPNKTFNHDLPGYLRFPFANGKYRLFAGTHFTEEITFDFSGAAVCGQEPVAVIPTSWHARCNAIRGVFADDTVKGFDDKALISFGLHMKLKHAQREYGFLNYGDWFGERAGCNWGNNEYDFAYGLLTLFARTGNRDVYRLGIAAARHQSDVDMIHATPFWNLIGGNHMHCVGHVGRRGEPNGKAAAFYGGIYRQAYAMATNGHSWVGGMYMAFLMSGRADIGDTARLLSNQFIIHSGTPYRNQGNPRSHGWMLEGLMQSFEATGDQKYLDAATKVANSFFATQALEKGGAWPHDLPGGYLTGGLKKGFGTSCFQMGVVIQALHHYSIHADRPEIRKNLAAAAGWMRKSFIPAGIGWPYVASWDGAALWPPHSNLNMLMLAASKADGSSEADPILISGVGLYMLRGVGANGIGKNLAMDLIFAPATFEMLKSIPGKKVFTTQSFIDNYRNIPHFMRLRGPEKMSLDLTLKNSSTTLHFERNFYNPRKSAVKRYQVVVRDKNDRKVFSFDGDVNDRRLLQKQCVLKGKKGDRFTISITDNISSYWEVFTADRIPVRVHLNPASQFANGVSLFFQVRVPAGVKKFTVQYLGCHLGTCGIIGIDPDGKIIGIRSQSNDQAQLPWLKKKPERKCDMEIVCKDSAKEQLYSFFTWSPGDVLINLKGVKPVIEFIR